MKHSHVLAIPAVLSGIAGAQPAHASPTVADVLGFETTSAWHVSGSSSSLVTVHPQGQYSLAVPATGYVRLDSAPLGGSSVTHKVAYDVQIPAVQVNPYWYGATQLFVSAPSKGIYNQFIGQEDLMNLPPGQFRTVQMSIALMGYNPSHWSKNVQESVTPGNFMPEELYTFGENTLAFPDFTYDPVIDNPTGRTLQDIDGPCFLPPMDGTID